MHTFHFFSCSSWSRNLRSSRYIVWPDDQLDSMHLVILQTFQSARNPVEPAWYHLDAVWLAVGNSKVSTARQRYLPLNVP